MNEIISFLTLAGIVFGFTKAISSKKQAEKNRQIRPVMMNQESGRNDVNETTENADEVESLKLMEDRKNTRSIGERNIEEQPLIQMDIPVRKKKINRMGSLQHITRAKLREGIVMAEILSEPPRAKNPHPAASRYRRKKS